MSDMSIPERPLQPSHFDGASNDSFDIDDEDHWKQLFPHERQGFRDALQDLLQTRKAWMQTNGSFGADKEKVLAELAKGLDRLGVAVIDEWLDNL